MPVVGSTSMPSSNICESELLILNGTGASTYTWSGGISNNTAFIPPPGSSTYLVTGTNANGCSNTSTQTIVAIRAAIPLISVSSDIIQGSIGDAVLYTANINLAGIYSIDWYRDNLFQITTSTNTWSTTIVEGDNAVKAVLTAPAQCLQPDSGVGNIITIKSTRGISVYPNPTSGETINTGLMVNDNISLYNSIGQRIFATTGKNILSNQNKLKLNQIASGTYIIQIKRNDEIFVRKIIKTND